MTRRGTVTLLTDRLVLRRFTSGDLAAYTAIRRDAEMRWDPFSDPDLAREIFEGYLDNYAVSPDFLVWAIEFGGTLAGSVEVTYLDRDARTCELGYLVAKAYRGKGIATEAVSRVTRFLVEVEGFTRIMATTERSNRSSRHVLERSGFAPTQDEGLPDGMVCYLIDVDSGSRSRTDG